MTVTNIPLVKIPIKQLVKEDSPGACDRFSHPAFKRKLEKDAALSDVSISEKLLELEYKSGNRYWFDFQLFFGKVICNAEEILILHECGITQGISIVAVAEYKVKRTRYLKLIFETDLPF